MSFLKSRQITTPPTTGMSAGEWLEARKKERISEGKKVLIPLTHNTNQIHCCGVAILLGRK